MIVPQGLSLTLVGTVIGLAGATASARLIGGLLYNIRPLDLESFAMAVATMITVACVACYLPARRAGRTDPTSALRAE